MFYVLDKILTIKMQFQPLKKFKNVGYLDPFPKHALDWTVLLPTKTLSMQLATSTQLSDLSTRTIAIFFLQTTNERFVNLKFWFMDP